jgi:hypothetical protein
VEKQTSSSYQKPTSLVMVPCRSYLISVLGCTAG